MCFRVISKTRKSPNERPHPHSPGASGFGLFGVCIFCFWDAAECREVGEEGGGAGEERRNGRGSVKGSLLGGGGGDDDCGSGGSCRTRWLRGEFTKKL